MLGIIENVANAAANNDLRVKTAKTLKDQRNLKGMIKSIILLKVSKVIYILGKILECFNIIFLLVVPSCMADIGLILTLILLTAGGLGFGFLIIFLDNVENDMEYYSFWIEEYKFRKAYHSYRD